MNVSSLPKFYDLMLPLLEIAADGTEVSDEKAEQALVLHFQLNEEQVNQLKPSGRERLFLNKMRWAKTNLFLAKLLQKTKRCHFRITTIGKEVLLQKPKRITEKFLAQFDGYRESRGLDVQMEITWSMPSKWTFEIPPIAALIEEEKQGFTIDPFAGRSTIADIRNDINPASNAQYHMDALDFLKMQKSNSADTILEDGIYSPTQLKRSYNEAGLKLPSHLSNQRYFSNIKKEIARIIKYGGKAICCGWTGGGIGKKYGFRRERVLIVTHGGNHNLTCVTVERKVRKT